MSGTVHAAEATGISDQTGALQPGKAADLVALAANPLEDISAVLDVRLVMRDGNRIQNTWRTRHDSHATPHQRHTALCIYGGIHRRRAGPADRERFAAGRDRRSRRCRNVGGGQGRSHQRRGQCASRSAGRRFDPERRRPLPDARYGGHAHPPPRRRAHTARRITGTAVPPTSKKVFRPCMAICTAASPCCTTPATTPTSFSS